MNMTNLGKQLRSHQPEQRFSRITLTQDERKLLATIMEGLSKLFKEEDSFLKNLTDERVT